MAQLKPSDRRRPSGRRALLLLAAAAFCLRAASGLAAEALIVDWVPDGDTLIVQSGESVRLKGIDAPETAHDGRRGQFHARASRRVLASLVRDRELEFSDAQKVARDRYGRLLAAVRLPDGRLLNRVLIERGAAYYYPHEGLEEALGSLLLRAQRKAMQRGTGFWPDLLACATAREHYTGHRGSGRFHSGDCGFGRRIGRENRIDLSGLREAFRKGYAPCRKCTPWPEGLQRDANLHSEKEARP